MGRYYLRQKSLELKDSPIETYEEKNLHITPQIQQLSNEIWKRRMYNLYEVFWLNLTEETNLINRTRVNKLNRGISLANLGISQIIQTKIGEGTFNLYRALADDEAILKKIGLDSNPEKNFVESRLFSQFEHRGIQGILNRVIKPNLTNGEIAPTMSDLKNFFNKQQPGIRIFIFVKLHQLFSSLRRNEILNNVMSRQSVLDSLASLCLWIENSLRRKKPVNGLYEGLNFMKLPSIDGSYGSNDLDGLVKRITIVETNTNIKIRRALITLLIRNYSGHNLETKEHSFFDSKEKILSYVAAIFFTMLFLDSEGKI